MGRFHLPQILAGPRFTAAAVVLGNLMPVLGVMFLGWDGAQILILYWFENIIVGVLTVPRIMSARGSSMIDASRATSGRSSGPVGLGCFFMVHYGIFCIGHGIFAAVLAGKMARAARTSGETGVWEGTLGQSAFWWTVLAIAVLHLILHVRDWWLAAAWRTASPTMEMFRPYGRIFVLHLTVLGGAWMMAEFNAPASAVLLLCFGKMALELIGLFLSGRPAPAPAD